MTNALFVFGWAWLAAARITRLVWADDITVPVHEWLERRWRHEAARYRDPGLSAAARRGARLDHAVAQFLAAMLSCFWCVGFWVFALCTAGAWLVLGTPGVVLGGPAWWTLPCAALGTHWVFALITANADPAARG